jgi:calcineurin-like phosphoesterase family protein
MSKLMITSDLHLGHKNIHKFRPEFSSAEEHHEIIFDNLASNINKRDSLILLGDICFSKEWLERIKTINCAKTTIIVGNHDLEFGIHMRDLVDTYDAVYSLWTKRDFWFSHAPIHPQEMRGKKANIHGHLHGNMVWKDHLKQQYCDGYDEIDPNYINVCVEHTDWKPITFAEATNGY